MATHNKRRGFVFFLSLVSLLVMLIMGASLLGFVTKAYRDSVRAQNNLHAIAMADAGLNYLWWKQRWSGTETNSGTTPRDVTDIKANALTCDFTGDNYKTLLSTTPEIYGVLGQERYDAWFAKTNFTTSLNGYQIISRGTYRGYTRTVRTVITDASLGNDGSTTTMPPVTNYTVFSNDSYTNSGQGTIEGNLGSNNNVTLSGQANITGDLNSAKNLTMNGQPTVGGTAKYGVGYTLTGSGKGSFTSSQTGQYVEMPPASNADWLAYATAHGQVVTGSFNLSGTTTLTNPVIYIKKNADGSGGNLHITGKTIIHGGCTIIAEGGLTFSGQANLTADYTTTDASVTLISYSSISMTGQTYINGAYIYCHNPARDTNPNATAAELNMSGQATIDYGSITADQVRMSGQANINFRRASSMVVPPSPASWNFGSWELL
jgi:hypothetical protein